MILAFDTSAAHCAATLLSGDTVLAHKIEPMAKGQAERLLGLCEDLMQDVGTTWQDLKTIGVGIGPGNFTGIRIAVSAARGLALGLNIPAVGVSNFDALHFGQHGPCACAVDARRGQVYFQAFGAAGPETPVVCDPSDLPPFDGPLIGEGGAQPRHAATIAMAHIAAARSHATTARPAPMYLRAPDAAPARDAAPTILV